MSGSEKQYAAEIEKVGGAVTEFAAEARAAGERPEGFWRAQRVAIRERMEERERVGAQPLVRWAVAFAALVLFAALLPQPVAPPVISAERTDPDHELLLGVEQTMRRSVPRSLAAAEFLAAELNQAAQKQERQ